MCKNCTKAAINALKPYGSFELDVDYPDELRSLADIKRIAELEKERDIRDLEQQAKGIEDFSERYCRNSIELEHEAVLACAFQYAEQLSKQAKAIEEKQNEN